MKEHWLPALAELHTLASNDIVVSLQLDLWKVVASKIYNIPYDLISSDLRRRAKYSYYWMLYSSPTPQKFKAES